MAGRTTLIVGGSRGIGEAIATSLLDAGGRVVVTAHERDSEELEVMCKRLASRGAIHGIAGRSDDPEHRVSTVRSAVEAFGGLDALVVVAGTNPQFGPLVDADLGAVQKVLQVNVVSPLGWVQACCSTAMRERGGSVVLLSSINARRTIRDTGAYNVSKAALSHLTRQLALELAPHIRVNAIEPGVVRTRFARALYSGREDELRNVYPMGRLGEPEDIATAATFLLSPDAAWITGSTLVVDGGVSLVPPE